MPLLHEDVTHIVVDLFEQAVIVRPSLRRLVKESRRTLEMDGLGASESGAPK